MNLPSPDLANARTGKASTLAELAYQGLKRDIISGALSPGLPLRLEFLKQRYQLSFTPLREALNRLQSERLVDSIALKGFRVALLSIKEMQDSMSARVLIDCEALSRSIDRASDEWETGIVAALHALDLATGRQRSNPAPFETHYDVVEQRHLALHRALISACDSRWLLDFSQTLYVQTERYRRPMLMNLFKSGPVRDVTKEHQEIVDAALARDHAAATRLLGEHYKMTARLIEHTMSPLNAALETDGQEAMPGI